MNLADHIASIMEGLTVTDLDNLPPARLQKFEALLDHWQKRAAARVRTAADHRGRHDLGVAAKLYETPVVRPVARNGEHASR